MKITNLHFSFYFIYFDLYKYLIIILSELFAPILSLLKF